MLSRRTHDISENLQDILLQNYMTSCFTLFSQDRFLCHEENPDPDRLRISNVFRVGRYTETKRLTG